MLSQSQPRRPARSAPRGAFTLLELLVALGLIATLLALLLPAVQSARAAAAKVECANNLKQLALALHAYHNTHQALPPGMSLEGGRSPMPFLNWHARVLPYLEQQSLWRDIQVAYAEDREFLYIPPHWHRTTRVPTFVCPADMRARDGALISYFHIAFTSYLGNLGLDLRRPNGVLFLDSRVRLGEITDGTSNTLLIGERPPSADYVFGWWYAGWGQKQTGSLESVLGARERNEYYSECPSGPFDFGPAGWNDLCDTFHFWSRHRGGCNFAFGDGSVRFLSYSASSVLPALATRAGGEPAAVLE